MIAITLSFCKMRQGTSLDMICMTPTSSLSILCRYCKKMTTKIARLSIQVRFKQNIIHNFLSKFHAMKDDDQIFLNLNFWFFYRIMILGVYATANEYWTQYTKLHTSIVDKLLIGLTSISVSREWWGKTSHNYEPFLDLSLDPYNDSVQNCLNDYFSKERIGKSQKYTWDDWNTTTKATIAKKIERAPKYLMIHLKRFDKKLKKNTSIIMYDHELDISNYMSEDQISSTNNWKYSLSGFIMHLGKEWNSGHYVSFFKRDDNWYHFDDNQVFEIEGGKCTTHVLDHEVYMLLYKQL